jgi:hypothetical protein
MIAIQAMIIEKRHFMTSSRRKIAWLNCTKCPILATGRFDWNARNLKVRPIFATRGHQNGDRSECGTALKSA